MMSTGNGFPDTINVQRRHVERKRKQKLFEYVDEIAHSENQRRCLHHFVTQIKVMNTSEEHPFHVILAAQYMMGSDFRYGPKRRDVIQADQPRKSEYDPLRPLCPDLYVRKRKYRSIVEVETIQSVDHMVSFPNQKYDILNELSQRVAAKPSRYCGINRIDSFLMAFPKQRFYNHTFNEFIQPFINYFTLAVDERTDAQVHAIKRLLDPRYKGPTIPEIAIRNASIDGILLTDRRKNEVEFIQY